MAESYRYAPIHDINHGAPNNERSIFDFFSVKNHIKFLHKIADLPESEKRFYLQEDVLKFLGEFVAEVPYTHIVYSLKPDGLEYGGINIARVYQEAADLAGVNSQENADNEGFKKIHQNFALGDDNLAYLISPPTASDYGFVFVMAKKGARVDEYALRYNEERGRLDESNRILKTLTGQTYQNSKDFVRNPVTIQLGDVSEDLKLLLTTTGINQQAIEDSLRFGKQVKKRLSAWIDLYVNRVIEIAKQTEIPVNVFAVYEEELKTILAAIYNRAQDIKEVRDQDYSIDPPNHKKRPEEGIIFYDLGAIQQAAKSRSLTTGGGSCPVTDEENKSGITTPDEVIKSLIKGQSIESLIKSSKEESHYEHGTCSICSQSAEIGKCSKMCRGCEDVHFWPNLDPMDRD